MEYGIPLECLPEAVQRVREVTKHLSFPSLFPIEVRVSAADDIALSTGFGRSNGWVAVHQYVGAPHESYFQQVADIMDSYGGRPHWGKMHYLNAAQLCGGIHVGESSKNSEQHLTQTAPSATNTLTAYSACPTQVIAR